MIPPTARNIAVMALGDAQGNVTQSLRALLTEHELSPADRSLARELALGTLRRRGTLDTVLAAFLKDPSRKPPGATHRILQVATYQLLFLDRVPEFAAVNEAVKQAHAFGLGRCAGLVNGVLRGVGRAMSPLETGAPTADRRVVPISASTFRKMDRDIFADPAADPAAYLAGAYSLPAELATRWLAQANGDLAPVIRWAMHANTSPPVIARVNTLKTDVAKTLASLSEAGVATIAHTNGRSIVFTESIVLTELAAFRDGWLQPQDATATEVSIAAAPKSGMNVLDLCAAPGTKTMHMAELMENRGSITAVDISERKLQLITDGARRMGVDIVTTMLADKLGSLEVGQFDVVLADVPCSNTGVLARRAEARWRLNKRQLSDLVGAQKFLLSAAAAMVKPGGRVVYSTCSMEPAECSQLVKAACGAKELGLTLEGQHLIRPAGVTDPTQWHDGGFLAIFRRG